MKASLLRILGSTIVGGTIGWVCLGPVLREYQIPALVGAACGAVHFLLSSWCLDRINAPRTT
jgi:hypothetical protein